MDSTEHRHDSAASTTVAGGSLRRLRELRGLSVRELAALSQYSPSAISRFEHGSRQVSVAAARRLAAALEVEPAAVLGMAVASPRVEPALDVRSTRGGTMTRMSRFGPAAGMQMVRLDLEPGVELQERRSHVGYIWLFVAEGSVRLVVGGFDEVLTAGEAAEYDTTLPHAMCCAGDTPATVIAMVDATGERALRIEG